MGPRLGECSLTSYHIQIVFVIALYNISAVESIRDLLGNTDLRLLRMRLVINRQMEQVERKSWTMIKKNKTLVKRITSFGVMMWKEIGKMQMERRKKGKIVTL